LVVGEGPETRSARRIFADPNLFKRVMMTGKLTGEQLCDAYNAMDWFVFSSRSETQGMVLAEAMAAGVPVVALDGPGVREVIRDRGTGRCLPADTPATEFARALSEAVSRNVRPTWSKAARRAARRFSRESCAKRLEKVYAELTLRPRSENSVGLARWESLLHAIRAEWELLQEKMSATAGLLESASKENAGDDRLS